MTLTSPPTTTLSRSLLLRITAVVVLCLGVFGTSFYLLVVNPAVDRLARGELSRGMSRVEGPCRTISPRSSHCSRRPAAGR